MLEIELVERQPKALIQNRLLKVIQKLSIGKQPTVAHQNTWKFEIKNRSDPAFDGSTHHRVQILVQFVFRDPVHHIHIGTGMIGGTARHAVQGDRIDREPSDHIAVRLTTRQHFSFNEIHIGRHAPLSLDLLPAFRCAGEIDKPPIIGSDVVHDDG